MIKTIRAILIGKSYRLIRLGIGLSICFVIADIMFDVFYFREGDILESIFAPSLYEIYMRFSMTIMTLIFSSYAQVVTWRLQINQSKLEQELVERKRVEEALTTSEAELRALFAAMTDMVIVYDIDGRYVKIAPTKLASFYCPLDDMLGKTVYDILPKDQAGYIFAKIREAIQTDQVVDGEYALQIDGKERWFSASVSRLSDNTAVWLAHDITERKRAMDELHSTKDGLEIINLELQQSLKREELLARTDGLTGLCNHHHFFEIATREFHVAARYQRPLTFIMFDADNFKQVNDILGHAAGDNLLVMMAQTAIAQVRASDVLARYGGDEFIVMLPHSSVQQAFPVAERIRASVAAALVDALCDDKVPLAVTLSIGIAEMRLDPVDENVECVIQRADKALYAAKQSGRNRTVAFDMDKMGEVR